ncbi:MAG: FKBP-type peptidyl-prolyl cis-trans isomerase [Thermoprotei archaeon]
MNVELKLLTYMALKKGDFILLDFTARTKENNEVFDTTNKDVAKQAGIFNEKYPYEPVPVIIGEKMVVAGLENDLLLSDPGQSRTIEVPPESGFGLRDPAKIKVISERDLLKRNIRPEAGQTLEVNGQTAVVRSVNAGRVQLDFNHPLSGKTLIYEYTVRKVVTDDLEKALELVHRLAPSIKKESFEITINDSEAQVKIPEEILYWDSLQAFKITLVRDLIKYIDRIESVVFIERFSYKRSSENKEEVKSTQASTEQPTA